MQDLNDKITGGSLSAAEFNEPMSEIQAVIEALGQGLTTSDLNQLGKAIAGYAGASTFYSETGIADAYVSNPLGLKQGPSSLDANHDGLLVRFRPGNANTGASTLNLNAIGVKDITREDGSPLQSGDLITTRDAYVRWDQSADDFVLQVFSVPGALDVPRGYIDGLVTSPGADTANDIDFGIGICRDSTNADTFQNSGVITKQIDVDWVEGSNQGGFPSLLTRTTDKWYHLFAIKSTVTGVVDFGFDTSLTAVNLLVDAAAFDVGYTLFRRIGAVLTNATGLGEFVQYVQRGDRFVWNNSRQDINTSNPGTGEVPHTLLSTPLGLSVLADVNVSFSRPDGSSDTRYLVGPGDQVLVAPSVTNHNARTNGDHRFGSFYGLVPTSTVQIIKTQQDGSNSNATIDIQTHGWVDPRGKDV